MKDIKNFHAPKYDDVRYRFIDEGIYKAEDGVESTYHTSLSFVQEPDLGEGDNALNISQYPLEDILDTFDCYVSDFYEDLNTEESQVCYLEFASTDLEDIQNLRTIIGAHISDKGNGMLLMPPGNPEELDFGYSEKSPVFTATFEDEKIYLARLRSADGSCFGWVREGATWVTPRGETQEILVDKYQLYLNGDPYTYIYICPFGTNSNKAPRMLQLADTVAQTELSGDLEKKALETGLSLQAYIKLKQFELAQQQQWSEETFRLKGIYPEFNLETALQDPFFSHLLHKGTDMKIAYEQAKVQRDAAIKAQKRQTSRIPSVLSGFLGLLSKFGCLGIFILIIMIGISISQCVYENKEPVVFSQSVAEDNPVYADIVSIEPYYGIHQENLRYNVSVVCKCRTVGGAAVWVSMSTVDYGKYFDPEADLSDSFNASYEVINFSPAVRLHGRSQEAEDEIDGLSARIGVEMIIDFESLEK